MDDIKRVTIRAMYAEDDIMADTGYDGFCVYMVIDLAAEAVGEDPCLFVSLDEIVAEHYAIGEGWEIVDADDAYVYDGGWKQI